MRAVLAARGPPEEDDMGFMDDAKDAAETAGKKVGEWVDDAKERIEDKVDEMKGDDAPRDDS